MIVRIASADETKDETDKLHNKSAGGSADKKDLTEDAEGTSLFLHCHVLHIYCILAELMEIVRKHVDDGKDNTNRDVTILFFEALCEGNQYINLFTIVYANLGIFYSP